jgi:hypothetical protein
VERKDKGKETTTTKAQAHASPVTEPFPLTGLALICVSAGGDFDAIRAWGDSAAERLLSEGVVSGIAAHIRAGTAAYGVGALAVPGLRHFVYKSRAHVQLTAPRWEEPYADADGEGNGNKNGGEGNWKESGSEGGSKEGLRNRRRLITLYQTVHDAIHAKSGQMAGLKLQYLRTEKESVMGWVSP